jgi:hypothetical protein
VLPPSRDSDVGSLLPSVQLGYDPTAFAVWPVLGMLTVPGVQRNSQRVTLQNYLGGSTTMSDALTSLTFWST